MPLHSTGLVSRHDLFCEEEPVKIAVPTLEKVLKYDPSQPRDDAGRWTSGGRSGRHGTQGAPTEDAFGRPLRGNVPQYTGNKAGPQYTGNKAGPQYSGTLSGGFTSRGALSAIGTKHRSLEAAAAAALSGPRPVSMPNYSSSGVHGGPKPVPMPNVAGGPSRAVPMPNVGGKDVTLPKGQYFDEYGVIQETNPRRSAEAKAFHYKGAFHPGSMSKSGKPTKRSTFS